jgi:hypothetical protein
MANNVNLMPVTIFSDNAGNILADAVPYDGTFWFTKEQICELYDKDVKFITRHINYIFIERELDKSLHVKKWFMKNVYVKVQFFSLDVLIAVGYRVKSIKAQQFKKWMTAIIREKIITSDLNKTKLG